MTAAGRAMPMSSWPSRSGHFVLSSSRAIARALEASLITSASGWLFRHAFLASREGGVGLLPAVVAKDVPLRDSAVLFFAAG